MFNSLVDFGLLIMFILSGGLLVRIVFERIRLYISRKRASAELRLLTKELEDSISSENVP